MRQGRHRIEAATAGLLLITLTSPAAELAPLSLASTVRGEIGRFSETTLTLAIQLDRDQARLLGFTRKERPFDGPLVPPPVRAWTGGPGPVQVEVRLLGPGATSYTRRVDVGPICLDHPPGDEPHIAGDTILVHRDSFIVELPEVKGFDQIEVAYHDGDVAASYRRALGFEVLDRRHFVAAGGAPRGTGGDASLHTTGRVFWPEDYGDPDVYTVHGNEAEAGERINIVIIPDGYRYAEKALMQQHAQAMVDAFRARTPYREHDPFVNYILVYAYSTASGTDQCDCAIVVDTAMNTRFPDAGFACNNSGNRCLYYGTENGGPDCDPMVSEANIPAAELRAPAHDASVIMVNTSRYGGCGGARAVYSAGNPAAGEVAIHELGHSLAWLADEYAGDNSCGFGSGINVSSDPTSGAWPEWIPDLGSPRQGAQYYDQCIYRPLDECEMRSLSQPFCPVCNQQWALVFFGSGRVSPTAPVRSQTPASPAMADVGVPASFSVATRLASGANVTNAITWRLQGPGFPVPTVVATGSPDHDHIFAADGTYTLTCEVIADTNFIKPARYGANVDTATWTVMVGCDARPTFAGLTAATDLGICAATGVELTWAPASFGPDGGTYDIWRDGVRILRGVAGSPFVDVPGNTVNHTYRVRAATADCDVTDTNTADRTARDATGDPAPIFAGIRSATDLDSCFQTGVELIWQPAAFGPAGGTYTVHRDGMPIATMLTATSFVDLPGDSLLHAYRVLAVTGDCGGTDGNSVDRSAADAFEDPGAIPPDLANTVRGRKASGAVELSWPAAPGAATYNVYRSATPGMWPTTPDESGLAATLLALPDLLISPPFLLYRASGTTCSGREGP